MQLVAREVGVRENGQKVVLGTVNFPEYSGLTEAVATFGEGVVFNLFSRALDQDMERVARENFKKEGATEASVQAVITAYRPGARQAKPSIKNYNELIAEFVEAGDLEAVKAAFKIYKEEDHVAAFNYLMELKRSKAA